MFRFMLAPLEGYSAASFRALCSRHGADLTFTEMAHVESFLRGNRAALRKIEAPDDTPFQIQILTGGEDNLKRLLEGFTPLPGFAGFNLNLSCPSREVISRGKGAAMVKRGEKVRRLVSLIRGHGHPASVKLRLGVNAFEKANRVYLNAIRGVEADFFVVHSKTASEESRESEDYSVYPECVEAAAGTPVIANGGVDSVGKVTELRNMGVAGVMIGRAALSNPAVFDALKNETGFNEPKKPIPGVSELREEYDSLSLRFGGDPKYRDSFHRVLGKPVHGEFY